jgi:hypothetical protein
MSILTKKKSTGSNGDINWDPSKGWHEARIIAVCAVGKKINAQSGKMVERISVVILTDENVEIGGDTVGKVMVETFNDSLHEKSGISTKLLNPMGVSVESYDELLGQALRIKTGPSDCGNYTNILNVDESEDPMALPENTYLPKYLIQKNGEPTGYEILSEDGVMEGLRPDSGDSTEFTAEAPKGSKDSKKADPYA